MTHAPTSFEYLTPQDQQFDTLEALLGAALHFTPESAREWAALIGPENFRAARQGGRIVAGLGFARMGQWYGGRSVPLAAITAVGVSPDMRGTGVGTALLRGALEELRAAGTPLAALYPSSLRFYRRAGFERAGQRVYYEMPLEAIDVDDRTLDLVPIEPAHYDQVKHVYATRAVRSSGNLDRPEWMWKLRLEPKDKQPYRFLVRSSGRNEGYVVFTQGTRAEPLTVLDVCALTPAAGRRILGLLAGYRSMVEYVTWTGGPLDPFAYLLGEQLSGGARNRVTISRTLDWVLRIVDVTKALEARGYPPHLQAELHFDLHDDILPANTGRFVLRVADGRATMQPGGEGRIQLGAHDMAAIYSGYMTPHERVYLGTIAAPDDDLALAGAVFGGPRPWIADMF
ncbi:MAG TPA: GNAT family N-acetyltransferase [Roseiflexaceae bacterium]|nr:GNAT family N-acetyltransferase [Roseiflexaceae bacterium]